MASRILSRVMTGKVMHRRHLPVENHFVYPVFSLLLKMDELEYLNSWLFGVNRWRPVAFHEADYGNGSDLVAWVRGELKANGIEGCTGSIRLQTFPRVFGFVFNPVSFWYCEREDGQVGAIIAEVNNTFGERHCYILQADASGNFKNIVAEKRMYVSPFYPVEGQYRFRFNTDFSQPKIVIDYFNKGELQLNTAIWGEAKAWSTGSLLSALLKQPFMTAGVVLRIHWQALRLWLKGVSLFDRPTRSTEEAPR